MRITGKWWYDELVYMNDAFLLIIDAFVREGMDIENAESAFLGIFSSAKLNRVRKEHSYAKALTKSKNRIDFYNGTFTREITRADGSVDWVISETNAIHGTFVHELAHIWDRRERFSLADGLKAETGGWGELCLGSLCMGRYRINRDLVSPIRGNVVNSREDWAYAFDTFVVAPGSLQALNVNNDVYTEFISQQIRRLGD